MKKIKRPTDYFYNKQSNEEYEESLWGNYENSDNLPISHDHPYDDTNIDNLKDYFKYCEKVGLQVELTQEFPINRFVLSGGVDLLYDFETHPKKPEGLYNCMSEAIFDSSFEDFPSRGWHAWTHKWMIQDIMARGTVIPINVGVWKTKNWVHKFKSKDFEVGGINRPVFTQEREHWGFFSCFQLKRVHEGETDDYWVSKDGDKFYNRGFTVHPGGGKINVLNFLKIKKSPALVTSWKDDKISYGGKIMKTVDDYVDLIKSISNHYATFLNHDEDNAVRAKYVKNPQDVLNFKKVNIYSKGNYKLQAYLDEPPACFGKILENTFPLKIYIGSEGEKDFDECKRIIKNNRLREKYHQGRNKKYNLFGSVVSAATSLTDFHPKCIKIGRNEFDKIPPNNKGFVIYTDSSIIWHRDVFELLFFGNYKKAFSRVENDNRVILFNCDYVGWKYTNMENIDEFDITKLPSHYLEQEVVNDFR